MQAFSALDRWTPPTGTLGELTRASFDRAEQVRNQLADLQARASAMPDAKAFASALRGENIRVIAEIKRASPSKGAIAPALDARAQAERYVQGGAAAISVLTEPSRFGGALDDLSAVSAAVDVPVIRKDFIVAPVQIWEARAAGASAVLLIARALDPNLLPELMACAHDARIGVLVEIRDEQELHRALAIGATVIGVNNRNLETLVIDPGTAPRLIPRIPDGCVAVAESGMTTVEDVRPAAAAGADAILVGSAISAAADPVAAVASLASLMRRPR